MWLNPGDLTRTSGFKIFINLTLLPRIGCDKKSVVKRNKAGLNSGFSFSWSWVNTSVSQLRLKSILHSLSVQLLAMIKLPFYMLNIYFIEKIKL